MSARIHNARPHRIAARHRVAVRWGDRLTTLTHYAAVATAAVLFAVFAVATLHVAFTAVAYLIGSAL